MVLYAFYLIGVLNLKTSLDYLIFNVVFFKTFWMVKLIFFYNASHTFLKNCFIYQSINMPIFKREYQIKNMNIEIRFSKIPSHKILVNLKKITIITTINNVIIKCNWVK